METANNTSLTDFVIYAAILALACVQVFLLKGHFVPMLLVAFIQAFLAVNFFMHLGSEKRTLRLALIPATLFVLMMMNMIWSDSYRLMHLKPFAK
jgi:heme/copper-type cytochrome/quinol oxidase subunit 4